MLKKRRQRGIAEKQRQVRQLLWEPKPVQIRKEHAAIMIQKAFRAYKIRKARNAIRALEGDLNYSATIKVQRAFRSRARRRLQRKKQELRRLSAIKFTVSKEHEIGIEDTRRFYELQDELAAETDKLINKKLLLRPSTRFSVVWKILFIICIVVEISQLIAKPWLDSFESQRKGEPMTMSDFVALSFVPTRASQRPECVSTEQRNIFRSRSRTTKKQINTSRNEEDDLPWYCKPPGADIQEGFSDVISLLLVPVPVAEWPDCRDARGKPWRIQKAFSKRWYCYEPYRTAHAFYRKVFDFILEEFLVLASIVCFLDAFVTFFTGELDDSTGVLTPKSMFARRANCSTATGESKTRGIFFYTQVLN